MGRLRVSTVVFGESCKDAHNPVPEALIEGDFLMKRIGVGLLAVLFSLSAYAAKNSQTVVLTEAVQVGSTQLPAGPVKVSWTGTGSNAQVTLVANKKSPITFPAQVVDEKHPEVSVTTDNINGVKVLQEVNLENVKLVLRTAPTAAGN
jgi:hypothetical protein